MKAKNQNSINWDLLAKKMAGELNSEEEEMMNQWRSQNSENEKDFNEVKKLWGETKYARELEAVNTDEAWNKVQQKCEGSRLIYTVNGCCGVWPLL